MVEKEVAGIKPDFELTKENEFRVWEQTACLPTRGSSLFGLALVANKHGIPSRIIVEEPDYKFPGYRFKSYTKKEIDVATFHSELFRKRVEEADIKVEERDFGMNEIKDLLKEKKVLMIRVIIGILRDSKLNRRNPHYITVIGYDGEFSIIDPKNGPKKVSEEIFSTAFDAVHDCRRDHRMIVFG